MHIVLLESLGISKELLKHYTDALEKKGHTFAAYERTADVEALKTEGKQADAVILANMPLPAEVIGAWDKTRFIDIAFTGVDHVAVEEAKRRGILLSNASGYSTQAVAELTLCQMLNLLRHVQATEARCRNGGTKDGLVGEELSGKTVGIVGYGKIGARVAALCLAFGCKVLATSRSHQAGEDGSVRFTTLETLLAQSDIVALHCPLTADTRGLIDDQALEQMKKTALLINMARGPVVDQQALKRALDEGKIAGAAVDVFDKEPPLPTDHPLLACKNLLATPHIAFASRQSMEDRARIVFDNLDAWLSGGQKNAV